jgi:hypothetical protein
MPQTPHIPIKRTNPLSVKSLQKIQFNMQEYGNIIITCGEFIPRQPLPALNIFPTLGVAKTYHAACEKPRKY